MANVAGMYTSTYGGSSLGITNKGFEMNYQVFKEKIIGDVTGDATLDNVYLGKDLFFDTVLNEYNASAARAAFWAYASTFGQMGLVSRLDSSLGASLVLTAVSGTPAATAGPVTLTVTTAILADNFPINILLGSRHRKIPIRMQALLGNVSNNPSGSEAFFTVT